MQCQTKISIHALLAESDEDALRQIVNRRISIHALLAESDRLRPWKADPTEISIHALLAESDNNAPSSYTEQIHFYPRSPCGERLVGASQGADFGDISIHALLAESDGKFALSLLTFLLFLSTLSLRRATQVRHMQN